MCLKPRIRTFELQLKTTILAFGYYEYMYKKNQFHKGLSGMKKCEKLWGINK